MSEYVPTTADIRSDYGENAEGTSQVRLTAFDRWLSTIQPSPDDPAMVERVASILHDRDCSWSGRGTCRPSDNHREPYRATARAVLAAIAGDSDE